MSLFNYLPINAFRLIYGVSIICCQEIGKHIIFVTMNLAVFSSVTRSCGEDILSILVRNNKKCLPKLLLACSYSGVSAHSPSREAFRETPLLSARSDEGRLYSQARLPTAVWEIHPRFSPVQAVNKANTKIAKQRTLRELASIIANLHNLSSSVKLKLR